MKKRWLIAAALVAGAACSETTRKDINRNKSGNVSQSRAGGLANSTARRESYATQNDNEDDTLSSEDCGHEGEAL